MLGDKVVGSMGNIARDGVPPMGRRLIEIGTSDGVLRVIGCTLRALRGVVKFTHMSRVANGA